MTENESDMIWPIKQVAKTLDTRYAEFTDEYGIKNYRLPIEAPVTELRGHLVLCPDTLSARYRNHISEHEIRDVTNVETKGGWIMLEAATDRLIQALMVHRSGSVLFSTSTTAEGRG